MSGDPEIAAAPVRDRKKAKRERRHSRSEHKARLTKTLDDEKVREKAKRKSKRKDEAGGKDALASRPQDQQISADSSPFYRQAYSLYLPLAPIAQSHPVQGLCAEHLSPLILSYYPPFRGVILSYSNPHCSDTPIAEIPPDDKEKPLYARSINEYGASFIWLTAEFTLLKPAHGHLVKGFINLQSSAGISILCWNFFKAHIDRDHLPQDWQWVSTKRHRRKGKRNKLSSSSAMDVDSAFPFPLDDEGADSEAPEQCFQDGQGKKIFGELTFKVLSIEPPVNTHQGSGILDIKGTLI